MIDTTVGRTNGRLNVRRRKAPLIKCDPFTIHLLFRGLPLMMMIAVRRWNLVGSISRPPLQNEGWWWWWWGAPLGSRGVHCSK